MPFSGSLVDCITDSESLTCSIISAATIYIFLIREHASVLQFTFQRTRWDHAALALLSQRTSMQNVSVGTLLPFFPNLVDRCCLGFEWCGLLVCICPSPSMKPGYLQSSKCVLNLDMYLSLVYFSP